MLINANHAEEVRIALVDGQKLYDLDIENKAREQKKASIYKAKITRVEPSLEAAFVDFGAERHGFLPLKEISRSYFKKRGNDGGSRAPIQDLVQEGQEIVVQVDKEERGNKGAALTTFISLAGRYMVLMPNNPRAGGISRRIEGEDRDELRDALAKLEIPDGMGVIVRTAGVGRSSEELNWDLDYLLQLWDAIQKATDETAAPALLYQENSAVLRAIRDNLRRDIGEVLIEGEEAYAEASTFIAQVMPHYKDKVKSYADSIPLFSRYQIESQIETAFQHTVKLPSGGSIVIDPTEALVSIDINSARATKGADIEETACSTNLEAAEEIARQLRIRDIGGLIVIDFIDMTNTKNQRAVENCMRDALEADRARVQVSRISRFGLMEMSRQRLRPSLEEITTELCPRCNGQGRIRDTKSLALGILRVMEEEALKERSATVRTQVPLAVGAYLLNEKRQDVADIEARTKTHIVIIPNTNLDTPHYVVERLRDDHVQEEGEIESWVLSDLANESSEQEIPQDTPVPEAPKPAVQTIQPSAPPPRAESPVETNKSNAGGFWGKLVKGLFSDDGGDEATPEQEKPRERSNNRTRQNNNRNKDPRRAKNNERKNAAKADRKDEGDTQGRSRNRNKDDARKGPRTDKQDNRDNRDSNKNKSNRAKDQTDRVKEQTDRTGDKKTERSGTKGGGRNGANKQDSKRNEERKPRATQAERQPDDEQLKTSKRMPKRDRSERRQEVESGESSQPRRENKADADISSKSTPGRDDAKKVADSPRTGETQPSSPSSQETAAQQEVSENQNKQTGEAKAARPQRAANDPRNRSAKPSSAAVKSAEVPEPAPPKVDEVDQASTTEIEVKEPEQKVAATKEPTVRSTASKAEPEKAKAESVIEEPTPEKAPTKAAGEAETAEPQTPEPKALESEAPEPEAAVERPSRAANDPREVKRRQREAELKSEGVIPAGRQDNNEGSSSN
ncbi:MAG: Rne/Rng family ribonuclease [Pseudomonadales bacterium]|nr:Rne/Rng family ribonuclease [Pseudomonadales bacterium]